MQQMFQKMSLCSNTLGAEEVKGRYRWGRRIGRIRERSS